MLRRSAPRQGDMERTLIVGLGNPGKKYARTRHNVGTDAIEVLAKRLGVSLKVGRDRAQIAETRINDTAVVLAIPTTYMNDSGEAVGPLARRYKIEDPANIIVVHDELDLEPGILRLKVGGGLAGHNGLKSISAHLHTDDYVRVRIGVGKPSSKDVGADHVLSSIPAAERRILDVAVEVAVDAIESIVSGGIAAAMQDFNGR
ncbi:MAG: peptidyl-tRNA hydrolase [actinobacterium acAcidi]|nr:MAG: peptidyl-tRNA hydrolase [actinobacterium acAcidi]